MKKLVTSYTFDASERTVTSDDFTSLEKILLITNVTDQIIIYNFADQTKGGTLALTVLTLEYDTTSMDDGDKLQIFVEDAAVVQPISGTVTAELSATDNAVLDEIKVDTEAIETAVEAIQAGQLADGHNVTVDNASLTVDLGVNNDVTVTSGSITATQATGTNLHVVVDSAPTTAVTGTFWQATQPVSGTVTANLSATDNAVLDDIAAKLGTIDTDTGNIATAVQLIDNAISGSEMQVDVVASLPEGTNAIGKLSANSGVDIGDVTVNNATTTPLYSFPADFEFAGVTTHVKKYYTSAGAATDGVVWSPAAGKRWYITDLIINVSASCTITLEDDLTAGDAVVFKAELSGTSGISHSFNTPLFSGEDAADLLVTTTAGNVYITITGYEI